MNPAAPNDPRLDRYLDGLMSPEERSDFELQIAAEPALAQQVRRQREIDAAIQRLHAAPPLSRADQILSAARSRRAARPLLLRLPLYAQAACVALVLGLGAGGFMWWLSSQETFVAPPPTVQLISLAQAYRDKIATGFDGEIECRPERALEFAAAIWRRTDQGLGLPTPMPSNIELLGFSKCPCLGYATLFMMARVDGREVIVFFDRRGAAEKASAPDDPSLHMFRRDIGPAALIELTPLDHPALIDLFFDPGFSEETLSSTGSW